jgi:hypothetical protein
MKPEDQIITKQEYINYIDEKQTPTLNLIWSEMIKKLSKEMQQEAKQKGFQLIEQERLLGMVNLIIKVPNASKSLNDAMSNQYPYILCLLD